MFAKAKTNFFWTAFTLTSMSRKPPDDTWKEPETLVPALISSYRHSSCETYSHFVDPMQMYQVGKSQEKTRQGYGWMHHWLLNSSCTGHTQLVYRGTLLLVPLDLHDLAWYSKCRYAFHIWASQGDCKRKWSGIHSSLQSWSNCSMQETSVHWPMPRNSPSASTTWSNESKTAESWTFEHMNKPWQDPR
jgi:hypothetical protein